MRLKKIIEAEDAVAVIHDGDVIASAGYGGFTSDGYRAR